MPLPKEIDYALHDEEVVNLINGQNKYFDWIIITCFYSALHFVRAKVFPLKGLLNGNPITYQSFDAYCFINKNLIKNKHTALVDLTYKNASAIAPKYDWLLSSSVTARLQRLQN